MKMCFGKNVVFYFLYFQLIQDGHDRDFQVLTRQGLSGRKAGNLKEVGLGWISGGRKDRGFEWGKIRDGGEQLF